ncbi:MAG TPA: hypothetical protein VIK15_01085 [Candidatus Anoxymicrobiaceae bacterium]
MRFSLSGRTLAIVSVLVALLLAFPALAMAADSPVASHQEPRKRSHEVQTYVRTDPQTPSDPRPEMLKKMAQTLPEEYLPDNVKPEKDKAASSLLEGTTAGAGTGGFFDLSKVYPTVKDPKLLYSLQDYVTDNSGRVHFLYEVAQDTDISGMTQHPGYTDVERLSDLYYRTFSEGVWSEPVKVTSRSGTQSNVHLFFDVDDEGVVHLVFSRYEFTFNTITNSYYRTNENIYYRYLPPGGTWSNTSKLTGFGAGYSLTGASFRLANNKVHGCYLMGLDRQAPYPGSYRAEINYLTGALGDWKKPVTLDAWDWSFTPGGRMPWVIPQLDISTAGGEVFTSWAYTQWGPTISAEDSRTITVSRVTVNGTWQAIKTVFSGITGQFTFAVRGWFRSYTNQPCCTLLSQYWGFGQSRPPSGNMYMAYQQGPDWKVYNVSTCGPDEVCGGVFIWTDQLGAIDLVCLIERESWDGSNWQMSASRLVCRVETAPGVLSAAREVLGYQAGRVVIGADVTLDPDGGVHVLYAKGKTDRTSQGLFYTEMPAGKNAFSAPVMLRDLTSNIFDYAVMSSLSGGRMLCTWMEFKFNNGPQVGAIYSRMLKYGQWTPAKLVSQVPGNKQIRSVQNGYPWYYELGQSSVTGEQQAVFEVADYVNGVYKNPRKYWCQTTDGVWSEPELIFAGGPEGATPQLDMDLNGRSMILFQSADLQTGKNAPDFTEQKSPTPPSTTYFAEGTTRDGFDEWLSIQNANYTKTKVKITYMLENGDTPTQQFEIAPRSRYTVDVRAAVGAGHDVSAMVTGDQVVAVERPMYFDYNGWTGGSVALGVISPSRTWFFAEGTTRHNDTDGQFDAYMCVENPTAADANVSFRFLQGDGTTKAQSLKVPASSRRTLKVNDVLGADKDFSTVVDSDTAVLVERSMYFDYRDKWSGGHVAVGAASPGNAWYLAEGTTRDGFDEWLTLENPSAVAATATLDYMPNNGPVMTQKVNLPANSRVTVDVSLFVGRGRDVSVEIWGDRGIIVERPMYFNYNGAWTGGHDLVGLGAVGGGASRGAPGLAPSTI